MISFGVSAASREKSIRLSELLATITTESRPPTLFCTSEAESVMVYHVLGTVLAGTVPRTVAVIGTPLLKVRNVPFHESSVTSLTSEVLAEPAAAADVVLNFNFTDDKLLPGSEVRSNFRKVFFTGEELAYKLVLVP